MRFLKSVWRTITAMKNATTNIIFLVILALILIGLFSRQTIVVPESAALVIDPTGTIVEQKRAIPPLSSMKKAVKITLTRRRVTAPTH